MPAASVRRKPPGWHPCGYHVLLIPQLEFPPWPTSTSFVQLCDLRIAGDTSTRRQLISVSTQTDQPALEFTHARIEVGQAFEFLLNNFPLGQRVHEQTTVGVHGDHQVAAATLKQHITIARRNSEPVFDVERKWRNAAKHRIPRS